MMNILKSEKALAQIGFAITDNADDATVVALDNSQGDSNNDASKETKEAGTVAKDDAAKNNNDENSKEENETKKTKSYTQEEIDEMIERRINRAKKRWEKETADKKAEEVKKDDSEEINKLRDTIQKQNQRIVKSEAKSICSTLKVDTDMIDAVVALTDFSEVDLDDIDPEDIKEALEKTLKKYPKFIAVPAKKEEEKEESGVFKTGVSKSSEGNKGKDISKMTTKEKWAAYMAGK